MKQQILDILNELEKWRATRKLSIESQREGYIRNVMEELGELAAAIKTNNEHGYIDALCDIMVFTGNLVESKVFNEKLTEKEIKEISTQVKYYLIPSVQTPLSLLLEYPAMVSQKFLDTPGARATLVAEIFFTCKYLANQKGYSFSKSMNEVLKQINSRQGSWNEELKKWVKDTSDEAREKEYQANFDLAKLVDKGV